MRLSKLKLQNFRCFGPEETSIDFSDLMAIIGANSSGKTALLHALQKLFGVQNRDREIRRSDFHVPKGKKPEDLDESELHIEAIIEFPELSKEEPSANISVPAFFDRMVVESPGGEPYVRFHLAAKWKRGNSPEGDIDLLAYFINATEGDPSENEDKHRVPASSHHRTAIQLIYVPAIREPSSQLKNASGTILWRILNGINWTTEAKKKIAEGIGEVDKLFDEIEAVKHIQKVISTQWKSYHKDVRYSEARVKFYSSDLEDILKKLDVAFCPTEVPGSYSIDALGEGLRSLFYFSLVNSLLDIESFALRESAKKKDGKLFNILPPALTILAIEEPENHISPHLLGKVTDNLISIAEKDNAQVVLTSHTPSIVKRVDPEAICHLRIDKDTLTTIANKIALPEKTDEAYKYVKEAVTAYPEMYFARLVVLGEGDTESIIIPRALQTLGSSIDASGISVVPLGGRFVNHFWKLLKKIDMPFVTLLDLDSERSGGGWGRIKYVLNQLIATGEEKKRLLRLAGGKVLSDEELEQMHTWSLESKTHRKKLADWVSDCANYGVYFSSPLDLDFAMLKAYLSNYKGILEGKGGPRLPNKEKDPDGFRKRVKKDVRSTLKEEGGKGKSYSNEERELMSWYGYLFLNRSKPSTHILALSRMDSDDFKENLPPFLTRLTKRVGELLKDDPLSSVS